MSDWREAAVLLCAILCWITTDAGANPLLHDDDEMPSASFYGESYVSVPFRDSAGNTAVRLRFKTARPHGLLLLAAGQHDFLSLELTSGVLQARLDLGSGEAALQSPPGLRLDDQQWHHVTLNRTQEVVTLQVDNIATSSATTPGTSRELNIQHGIFLGSVGTFTESFFGNFKNFRGCMRDVYYSGYNILDSARRMNSPLNSFEVAWDCDPIFDVGSNVPISFRSDTAFVAFPHFHIRSEGKVSCDVKTRTENAVIFFNGGNHISSEDFIALEIVSGIVKLSLNKGNGVVDVASETFVSDGRWHQIDVDLSSTSVQLSVDGIGNITRFNVGESEFLNLAGHLFVGGVGLKARAHAVKLGLKSLVGQQGMRGSMVGCLRNMVINTRVYGFREMQVSRLVEPKCRWSYPCAVDPCIPEATCIEEGQEYKCVCDKQVCVKESVGKLPGHPDAMPSEVLAIQPLNVQEGSEATLTTNIIDVIFDYEAYRIRESTIQFVVKIEPRFGHLEIDLRRAYSGRFTLLDLMGGKISYVHDGTDSQNDDVTMEMSITNPGSDVPEKLKGKFDFVVPILIRPRNDPPRVTLPSGEVVEIIKTTRVQVTKDILNAIDPDTDPSHLQYHVTYVYEALGFLERNNQSGTPITTFTQEEVDNGAIWFMNKGEGIASFRLLVSDGITNSSMVDINFKAVSLEVSLTKNTGLVAYYGVEALITADNLTAVTNVPAQQLELRYRVTQPPAFGQLQRQSHEKDEWISVDTFTQRHIQSRRIRYVLNNLASPPPSDTFNFVVSAKDMSTSEQSFSITFRQVHLKLVNNNKLSLQTVPYIQVTDENLLVTGILPGLDQSKLIFSITRSPSQGGVYIMESTPKGFDDFDRKLPLRVSSNFSQADVNEGRVFYRLNKPSFSSIEDFIDLKVSFPGSQGIMARLFVEFIPEETSVRFTNNGIKDVIEGGQRAIERSDLYLEMDEVQEFQFWVIKPPVHGSLHLIDPRNSVVVTKNTSKFSSKDLREGRLIYHHDDSEHDTDSFSFSAVPLFMEVEKSTAEIEEFAGTFHISMLMRNDNPPVRAVDKVIQVVKFGERLLTLDDLAFSDPDIDYDSAKLQYTRRGIPNGEILHDDTREALYQFTQKDIADKKVLFRHRGADYGRASILVTDGQFYTNSLLEIQASDPYIRIVNNTGVHVLKGQFVNLSLTNLSVETNMNAELSEMSVVLIEEPLHGHLRKQGRKVMEFTMADIAEGQVKYWHDGGGSIEDSFRFAVLAGTDTKTQGVFPIIVFLESQLHPPKVIHNKLLQIPNPGETVAITSQHLHVTHADTLADRISYTVTSPPMHGKLQVRGQNPDPGELVTFTQRDIDQGQVTYIAGNQDFTSDKFQFDVGSEFQSLHGLEFFLEMVPSVLPFTASNLSVVEGGRVPFKVEGLRVTSRLFHEADIIFKVHTPPQFGIIDYISNKGVPLVSFSSQDVMQNKVYYQHDHSEQREDSFFLLASLADNSKHSLPTAVFISVQPVNDQPPRVVVNRGLQLWRGSMKLITSAELRADDADSAPEEVMYRVTAPTNGHLAFINNTFQEIAEFTQADVDAKQVAFVHEGGDTGMFKFQASDGTNSDILREFQITAAPLQLKLEVNEPLYVFPATRQPLTPSVLKASTSDKGFTLAIVFKVLVRPKKGMIITTLDGRPVEVTSFTQEEINKGVIFYEPTEFMSSWSTSDSFQFEVSTMYADPLKDELMDVRISYSNINAGNSHSLLQISEPMVKEGEEVAIARTYLDSSRLQRMLMRYSDAVQYSLLLVEPPEHGLLLMGSTELSDGAEFSQDDVDAGYITYRHDNSDTTKDFFRFTVNIWPPGSEIRAVSENPFIANFTIAVTPVNDQPFVLATKTPSASVVQGASVVIDNSTLRTEDPDTGPADIVYQVVTSPSNGKLVLADQPSVSIQTFTQQDINEGKLMFVHDGSRDAGAFYFKVSDGAFNPYYKNFNLYVVPLKVEFAEKPVIEILQSESSVYITSRYLNITTNGKRDNVWFNITKEPEHGHIYYQESPTKYFALSDVDNRLLLYIQQDMSAGSDYFVCDIYVSDVDVLATGQQVDIVVKPMVTQGPLDAPVGSYVAITKFTLDASQLASITGDNPEFLITDPPMYGQVVRSSRGKRQTDSAPTYTKVDSFTHEDIIYAKIYYVADEAALGKSATDSFSYALRANNVQPAVGDFTIQLQPPEEPTPSVPTKASGMTGRPTGDGGRNSSGRPNPWAGGSGEVTPSPGKGEGSEVARAGPNINGESSDYIFIIVAIIILVLIIVVAIVTVVLLRRRRRRRAEIHQAKLPKPRPFISGPIQLEQPHVTIEPQQMAGLRRDEEQALIEEQTAGSSIPVINVSHSDSQSTMGHEPLTSPPRSPDLSRQEVSQTVPACKVTPLFEYRGAESETSGRRSPISSAQSTISNDPFFDPTYVDPDLLQHCRTTTPVLRKDQYWV